MTRDTCRGRATIEMAAVKDYIVHQSIGNRKRTIYTAKFVTFSTRRRHTNFRQRRVRAVIRDLSSTVRFSRNLEQVFFVKDNLRHFFKSEITLLHVRIAS